MFLATVAGSAVDENYDVSYPPFFGQIRSCRMHDHSVVKSAITRLQRHGQLRLPRQIRCFDLPSILIRRTDIGQALTVMRPRQKRHASSLHRRVL